MYRILEGGAGKTKVQLLGSGTILREVIAAGDLLKEDFGVESDIWSVTSFNKLGREGTEIQRWNMLHPESKSKPTFVETCLKETQGPVIAATDYIRAYADQIRKFIDRRYIVLGTDGFGRSDTRAKLRHFFEVNRYYVTLAALKALADDGKIKPRTVAEAMKKYEIDPEKPNPIRV